MSLKIFRKYSKTIIHGLGGSQREYILNVEPLAIGTNLTHSLWTEIIYFRFLSTKMYLKTIIKDSKTNKE